jgi:hypothetical protein
MPNKKREVRFLKHGPLCQLVEVQGKTAGKVCKVNEGRGVEFDYYFAPDMVRSVGTAKKLGTAQQKVVRRGRLERDLQWTRDGEEIHAEVERLARRRSRKR